jgi:hypothetical protein
MEERNTVYIESPGPRPPFYRVAQYLWGTDCNYDSDGDSQTPADNQWTELTVSLRDAPESQQIDINPVSSAPLVLAVRSADPQLAMQVALFIIGQSGGKLVGGPGQ